MNTRTRRCRVAAIGAGLCLLAIPPAAAQTGHSPRATRTIMAAMNDALRELSDRVAPGVVQVRVSGYRPSDGADERRIGLTLSSMEAVGSGAIVDQAGLIITNAHVLAGADHIDVELTPAAAQAAHVPPRSRLPAKVVGIDVDLDIALLKIEMTGLHPLKMVDSASVRQGDIVFAFGSPEGLSNTMTMGIVSAVGRQLDLDSPNSYIQTDTPINPGNSGGPLVNADGDLVGITTLIVSATGASQGLGFAIPSKVVMALYPALRDHGTAVRGSIGIQVQSITAELAAGLHLTQNAGVIISDVTPDGPAQAAGAQVEDVLVAIDGVPVASVPELALQLFPTEPGQQLTLTVLRGIQTLSLHVGVGSRPNDETSPDSLSVRGQELVRRLGIIATNVDAATAIVLSRERIHSGVLVVARDERLARGDAVLLAGDIIHAVNGITVASVDALRASLGDEHNARLVLQIERDGRLRYVTQRVF